MGKAEHEEISIRDVDVGEVTAVDSMTDQETREITAEDILTEKVKLPSAITSQFEKKGGGINEDQLCRYILQHYHLFSMGNVIFIYIGGYYQPDKGGKLTKRLISEHIESEYRTKTRLNNVYELVLIHAKELEADQLNKFPDYWVNFTDCYLDPVTMTPHPHSPEDLAVYQSPWKCPSKPKQGDGKATEEFFKTSVTHKEDIPTIYEMAGCAQTRYKDLQKSLVLFGDGGTGKSTCLNFCVYAVGRKNSCSVSIQRLEQPFQSIRLLHKTLCIYPELPKTRIKENTVFNAVVTGDTISDSWKGKDVIDFVSFAKLMFSTNQLPDINDSSDGFFRRLLLVEFGNVQKNPDRDLEKKLKSEIEYFLYKSCEAFGKAVKRGHFTESEWSKKSVREYKESQDTVEAWMNDACDPSSDRDKDGNPRKGLALERDISDSKKSFNRTKLWSDYSAYCTREDLDGISKAAEFYKVMGVKGHKGGKVNGVRVLRGICERDMEITEDDIPFT